MPLPDPDRPTKMNAWGFITIVYSEKFVGAKREKVLSPESLVGSPESDEVILRLTKDFRLGTSTPSSRPVHRFSSRETSDPDQFRK